MATRGLVIGKFYPPHRGHKHLIDAAQAGSDELYAIMCAKPEQRPEGELRAAWLREIHPRAKVILTPDTIDGEDSKGWAEETVRVLGFAPDVVFTSEDYGVRYAGFLGCRHVLVDRERRAMPVSGTKVREKPLAYWDFLEPPVRAHYALRICIVGAESTGKTTLARALAEHYRTHWVPEYGRVYSEEMLARDGAYHWTSKDFAHIASTQCEHEEALAREANRVLVCDTDAFATGIWHRRYMGSRCEDVEKIAAAQKRPDLYLLADVKTPFVQDGTRDGEAIREWMHRTFVEELAKDRRPFVEVSGTHDERMRQATERIGALMRAFGG